MGDHSLHCSASVYPVMSETGTVKKFIEDKGFGFITPDDGGDDVFVHIKQCSGAESLSEGDQVSFDKAWNDRKGKYNADNVTKQVLTRGIALHIARQSYS